jgi:hypothetical protein
MYQKGGDQRCDKCCGGAHASFVHICQFHVVVTKRLDLRERLDRSR